MASHEEELNRRREERLKERAFRQQQSKLLKIALIATASVLILCAAAVLAVLGLVHFTGQPNQPSQPTDPSAVTTVPTEPQPTEADKVIHFVAGGDVNVTDKTVTAGVGIGGYDFSGVFMDILPLFANADLSGVNLEGNVIGAPYGTATHSAPQQLLTALKNAGVDFIQSANSLTIYNGINGMRTTLQAIRSAGMEPLGAYATPEEQRQSGGFVIREVGGIRVALVALTKGMDGMSLPEGSEGCVNILYKDYNSVYQKVDEAAISALLVNVNAQNPDVTIALLHWGSEYNSKISATQEKIRDLLLLGGVDAIIGTHSHYVQEVSYDAANGTLVAYGLGDLLGDAENPGTDYSVLLDLQITKSGATGKTTITGYDYVPLYLDTEEGIRIRQIRPALDAYENNALGKVSPEVYAAMKSALSKIEGRMK